MNKNANNKKNFPEFDFINANSGEKFSKSSKKYSLKLIPISKLKHHAKNNMLLPQLTNSELNRLKSRIKEYGFTENIEVTKSDDNGFYTVLDGNHRVKILREYKAELDIDKVPAKIIDIPEELEADYIVSKNYDRRQLSKLMQSYIRGKQYNALKKDSRQNLKQNESRPQNEYSVKTSVLLGEKYGLARSTIERDGRFSKICDDLIMLTSYEFVFNLLNGEIKANKSVIKNLQKLPNILIEKVFHYYRDNKRLELKPLKKVIELVRDSKNIEQNQPEEQWRKKSIRINSRYDDLISNLAKQKNIEEDDLINEALRIYIENNDKW